MILIFVNLILLISSLILSIICLLSNEKYYCIPFIILFLLFCLLSEVSFSKETQKYLRKQENVFIRNFSKTCNVISIYEIYLKNNILFDNANNEIVNLSGYVFKKSYIKALMIRLIRYDNKIVPYDQGSIFKRRVFVNENKIMLRIHIEEKVYNCILVKKNISKIGYIERKIIESPYFIYKLHPWSEQYLKKMKIKNELEYKNVFIK